VSGTARAEVLRRVRAAQSAGSPPVAVPREYRGPGASGGPARAGADLAGLLAGRLADYGAMVRRSPATGAPAAIAAALRTCSARRAAVPDGLPGSWAAAVPEPCLDRPPLALATLAAVDAVLTTVTVAIAETGTLILDHGPGQGRRELTLVPDVHVAVVARPQIVATVPDAVRVLPPQAPLTWISGPSATSDIELTRVQGVHGPRTLAVIILD
jgi:L-lactate dehydrogenase complex protein LldG